MGWERQIDSDGNEIDVWVEDEPVGEDLRQAVIDAYRQYLGRDPENEDVIRAHMSAGTTGDILQNIRGSNEANALRDAGLSPSDDIRRMRASMKDDPNDPVPGPGTPVPNPNPTTPPTLPPPPSRTPRPGGLEEQYKREVDAGTRLASDLAMARMIDEGRDEWERQARASAAKYGITYSPEDLQGIIRNLSYARNNTGGVEGDPRTYLAALDAQYKRRAESGGQPGNPNYTPYDTGWNDEDPARLLGKAPSAAYTSEMARLQGLWERETDPGRKAALRATMTNMFNGAYDRSLRPTTPASTTPSPTTTTAANILPPTTPPPAMPRSASTYTATPTTATVPYSARATTPYSATTAAAPGVPAPRAATATGAPPPWTPPIMPTTRPYQGTLAGLTGTSAAPVNPYAADQAWRAADQWYRGALQGAPAAPWAGIRESLARGPMVTAAPGTPEADQQARLRDQRRAYRFGQQEAAAQAQNAQLGQDALANQMDLWLRAYNDWNRRGTSPWADPTLPVTENL